MTTYTLEEQRTEWAACVNNGTTEQGFSDWLETQLMLEQRRQAAESGKLTLYTVSVVRREKIRSYDEEVAAPSPLAAFKRVFQGILDNGFSRYDLLSNSHEITVEDDLGNEYEYADGDLDLLEAEDDQIPTNPQQ